MTALLSLPEVADRLRVSRRTVENLIAAGELRALRPTPGRVAVSTREVDVYIAHSEARGRTEAGKKALDLPAKTRVTVGRPAAAGSRATGNEAAMATRRRRKAANGSGSVYYSKSERQWVAIVSVGTAGGRRRRHRARAATEDAAKAELERLLRLHAMGGDPATGTLGQYLEEWIRSHGRSIRPSTRTSYEGHIRMHIVPGIGGVRLSRLQVRDVRRLVDDLVDKGLSPATVHLVIRTLSVALNAAVAERAILDNATVGVRLPRIERQPVRPLTHDDAADILVAVTDHWLELPVRVLLGSGLRLGELVGLDQGDLLLDAGFVRIRHSKTTVRAVPVSDDAVDALRAALRLAPRVGPDEPVFFEPRPARRRRVRDRLRGDSVTHALPRLLETRGLPRLTPHALRHGAATLMLADGTPMRVIAEQLGHRNPALTARVYAHVVPEAQRAAVRSLEPRRAAR
jgi:integrase